MVAGSDADLAFVLTRLMRLERLDIEVAHVAGRFGGRRARRGAAQRVPLIRDDTGTVIVGSALWLPPSGAGTVHGEAVIDDAVLFDGQASGVRIEPTAAMPGLRATVLTPESVRAVGAAAGRLSSAPPAPGWSATAFRHRGEVTRSTFYRHTTGWLRVG